MATHPIGSRWVFLPLVSFTLALAGAASAETTGNSSAHGSFVDLSLAPLLGSPIGISQGPAPIASGNAPSAYSDGANVASLSVGVGPTGQILGTQAIQVGAESNLPAENATQATAVIDGLDLDLVSLLPLLTLNATAVDVLARVDGSCDGGLTVQATTTLENAQVGGTLGVGLVVSSNPAPNTVLLDTAGVRVVLNEQVLAGNGSSHRSVSVNAIHVQVGVSLLGIGVLSGDVVIGHAEAEVECGPSSTPTPGGGPTPTPGGGPTPTPGGGATPTPGVAPTPSPSPGPGGGDPYTNDFGLSEDRLAGATLNPGGQGQLLYGPLYDVRPVAGIHESADPQHVNVQIVNVNPLGGSLGGVLARVRFREGKTSREVAAFDIALSCAEVWAGAVFLDGGGAQAVPAIRSIMPIVSEVAPTQVSTSPELDPASGGEALRFTVPNGLTAEDVRSGYFEVIAEEQLPCEPMEAGGFSRTGNTYARLTGAAATPPNSLAGNVFLVRPLAQISYAYDMPALSRFVIAGGGSIQSSVESGLPDIGSCVGWNANTESEFTGMTACRDQIDLALSKAKLHAQYDLEPMTMATTHVAVTLPTKSVHCGAGGVASAPFSCDLQGESVGCRVFDREENEHLETCRLPNEMSLLRIGGPQDDPRADARVDVGDFVSGWLSLDLVVDPANQTRHERLDLDPGRVGFLGIPRSGFRGLPALMVVLQEFTRDDPCLGGSFGNAMTGASEMDLLPVD